MSKRERVASLASRMGLPVLLECLPTRPSLLVINYHRIGDPGEEAYDPGLFSASPEEFDWQVAYLKKHAHIVSLEEALHFARQPSSLKRAEVLISFDDGYLDNYQWAYPILRSHSVTATFFLVTSWVGTSTLPWWDAVAGLLKASARAAIRLTYPQPAEIRLTGDREPAIRAVSDLYKSPVTTDPGKFLEDLAAACGVTYQENARERRFLSWREAKEMSESGMGIGSHTHSHPILARLTASEQGYELRESARQIQGNVGAHPQVLAFPVGKRHCFDDATRTALEETGYSAAFSFYGGSNLPRMLNRYDIRRETVGHDLSRRLFRLRFAVEAWAGAQLI